MSLMALTNEKYDIIGDVHGMTQTLRTLIRKLGYFEMQNKWYHPQNRKLIFVGDILDRGPDPLGCMKLVMDLIENGCAQMVLGNHELNALHYMHGFREKNDKNTNQFFSTLRQIGDQPDLWVLVEKFLMTVPTRLELDEGRLRVIHACWHEESLRNLPLKIETKHLLRETAKGGSYYHAVENCLKGPETPCEPYLDKDKHLRTKGRIPWWENYPRYHPLVVFGHYWFPWHYSGISVERPRLLGPGQNAACVDFSVGKSGDLVAFRYPEQDFQSVSCVDRSS